MGSRLFLPVILLLSILFLLLVLTPAISVWSSPLLIFNVTPDSIYLNWTNYEANITLTANGTGSFNTLNITLYIFNTTGFSANYSQTNSLTACSPISLILQNVSGSSNFTGPLNGSASYNSSNMRMIVNSLSCNPGRYVFQNLRIINSTNATSMENVNITVTLDVPISTNNTLNSTTGVATFSGTMPVNATTYHSYYLNTTSVPNATSVTINLTGWASNQSIDMFLFDNSGNLKAKSINTTTSDQLIYNYLPTASQMWELRIYGNSTNSSGIYYSGFVIFGTLNVTNASNTGQQISLINFTSLFGSGLNVTNTSSINLTLKNEGSINLTNVTESKELYYVQRFGGNGNQNVTILVPNSSIASKAKVSVNWTGASNYSFTVYKPNGDVILTSAVSYKNANVTGAMQEIVNETTSIDSTAGYWKIFVNNNTNVTEPYNITTFVYVNESKWLSSNFSNSGITFNPISSANSTYIIQLNLTVQNDTLDGKYEGSVSYKDASGAILKIPLEATVKTGMLVINNTIDSATVQIDENIGTNITKVLNITINNTGSYSISFITVNSSNTLNLSSSNKNVTFSYNASSSPLVASGSSVINITIPINTTLTNDTQGVYQGYIVFVTNDSRPYQNFTLNLRLNLTNLLRVTFSNLLSHAGTSFTANTSAENITSSITIKYTNGTDIEADKLVTSNFSSWLISSNVSGYRVPATGNMSNYNGTNPMYSGGVYSVNSTIPNNTVGGVYEMHISVNYSRGNYTFAGEGISSNQGRYLWINNTGLFMSSNASGCSFGSSCSSSTISLNPSNSTTIYVNVTNFGPLTSLGTSHHNITINNSNSCSEYTWSAPTFTNCPSTAFAPSGNSTTCIVSWTVTATSGSGTGSGCTSYIQGNGSWYNPYGVNVTVAKANTTSSSTPPSSGDGPSGATTTASLSFTKSESLVLVQQNSTNSTAVTVKNNGTKIQTITFTVEKINSSWYTINSTNGTIDVSKERSFLITFSVGDVNISDYAGTYKAYSSEKTITSDFTLRVTPAPSKQSEINDTLVSYKTQMLKLGEEINKSKAEGINTTLAEQKYAELKSKIEQAENYISVGDYFSANSLLDQIKTLIDQTKTELQNAKKITEKQKIVNWLIYAAIGGGVAAAIFLAYLFWPTKPGYAPEKKEFVWRAKKEKIDVWQSLKDKWSEITKKMKEQKYKK